MSPKEAVEQIKVAYQLTFELGQPANVEVMRDLAFFCRANETCLTKDKDGRIDPIASAVLEGRREVWLRIQEWIGLSADQLLALKTGNPIIRRTS